VVQILGRSLAGSWNSSSAKTNEVTGAIVAMENTELKGERIDDRDVVPIPLMPNEAARDTAELQGR
jgi:hypothetical protein